MKVKKINESSDRPVILYKTKEPVYYNKGTQWEKTCDHFLRYYWNGSDEQAQEHIDYLNKEHPEKDAAGQPIDWDKIDHFYLGHQEMFDLSGS